MTTALVLATIWYKVVFKLVSVSWVGKDIIVQVNGHDESVKDIIVDEFVESVTDPFPWFWYSTIFAGV